MEITRRCVILRKTLLLTLICCSATCYTWHILSSYPVIDNRQHFISDVGGSKEPIPYWSSETFKERDLKSRDAETSRTSISGARIGRTYADADADTASNSGTGTSSTRLQLHAKDKLHEESLYHSAKPTSKNKLREPPRWSGDYAVKTWLPRSIKADAPDGQDVPAANVDAPGAFNVSGDMLRFSGGSPVKRLPQALIIGVKKCGTRALLEFLRLHPDIRATGPETHFFDRFYDRGLEWYRQQMPLSLDSQITMEKTPSYFITREVPRRLHQMSSSAKLVVVVRDPVTRAISDYTQTASKRGRPPSLSFDRMTFRNSTSGLVDTSWSAIRIGVYSRFLEWWTQYFSLNQIHFVSGENLIRDPAGEMARVQDFLGLKRVITDKHFYFNETKGFPCLKKSEGNGNPHCLGKTKGRTHPEISPSTVTRLRDFYRPFNLKFYQMVGRDFAWL